MKILPDPFDRLVEDNDNNLAQLSVLAFAAHSIKTKGFSAEAFENMAEAIQSIQVRFQKHNDQEERYLLPLIDRHRADVQQGMKKDHREVDSAMRRLMTIIHNIEEGRIHGKSIAELVETSETIVEILRNHITKENTMLIPLVRRMLSPEEARSLQRHIGL